MPNKKPDPRGDLAVEERSEQATTRDWVVVVHNDDFTTMEFVVYILISVFHLSEAEALRLTLTVHVKGRGVAGTYSREIAEAKVARVMKMAREANEPLLVTAEEA